MRARHLVSAAALLVGGLAAHADTVDTFTITGASLFYNDFPGHQLTLSGTTSIDVDTGVLESISFTAGGVFESGVDSQSNCDAFVGADNVHFTFTCASLINFDGGTFNLNGPNDLYVGQVYVTMDPTSSVTPEPSSIALLGSGMLGVAGIVRRRLV